MRLNKFVVALLVIFIVIGFYFVTYASAPGEHDAFAQCLSSKDATMYGAYWCSHCKNTKLEFGKSWKYINYVECDAAGPNGNPDLCRLKGVTGYPTWEIAGMMQQGGEMSLDNLAAISGCPLI
ncbi:MAG: hypothetical protein ABIG96_06880 [Candidatus Micrarchaeota archaeon]